MNTQKWLKKLVAAVIKGGAHAGSAWLGLVAAKSLGENVPVFNMESLWIVVGTSALLQLFVFLDNSPVPDDEGGVK